MRASACCDCAWLDMMYPEQLGGNSDCLLGWKIKECKETSTVAMDVQ